MGLNLIPNKDPYKIMKWWKIGPPGLINFVNLIFARSTVGKKENKKRHFPGIICRYVLIFLRE